MEHYSKNIDNLSGYIDKVLLLLKSNKNFVCDLVDTEVIPNNGSIKERLGNLLAVLELNYNDLKSIIQKGKTSKNIEKNLIDKKLNEKISVLFRCFDKIMDLSIKIREVVEEKVNEEEKITGKLEQLLKNTENIKYLSNKAKDVINSISSDKIKKMFFENNYSRPHEIWKHLIPNNEEILRASGEYLSNDDIEKLESIKNELENIKSNEKNINSINEIIKIINNMKLNLDENGICIRNDNAWELERLEIVVEDLKLDYKNERFLCDLIYNLQDTIHNINSENKKASENLMNDIKKLTFEPRLSDSENFTRVVFDKSKMILIEDPKHNIDETDNIPIELNYEDFSPSIFYLIFDDIINCGNDSYCFFTGEKNRYGISAAEVVFKHFRAYDENRNIKISTEELIAYISKKNINPRRCTKLFEIFVKIGDIEMVKWFVMNGINLDSINNLNRIICTSGNPDLIHYFEELNVPFNYDTLEGACSVYNINGPNVVNYLINDVFVDNFFNRNNLIELLTETKDPKIANIILNKLEKIGYDISTDNDNIGTSILESLFENNNILMVQYLTLSCPDIKLNKSLLRECIRRNNLEIFKLLFDHKGMESEKQENDFSKSLLFELAKNEKSMEITKFLFYKLNNVDLNVIYEQNRTLLHIAVINNNTEMINLLLSFENINVNVSDEFGYTPFYYAFRSKNFDIIKSFINNKNVNINTKDDCDFPCENKSILFSAIEKNNIDVVKLLLGRKDINSNIGYEKKYHDYSYDYIETPLIYAIKQGNIEVVKLLIDNPNTNVNKLEYTWDCYNHKNRKDEKIISPLCLAIKKENWEIVKLLLSCPAIDPNIGHLEYSCNIGENEDFNKLNSEESVLDYAIGKQENIRCTGKYYYTCHSKESPLSCAIDKNNCEIVEILIKNPKLNVNTRNKIGKTLLQSAIYKKQSEIVRLLLTYPGIDINMKNRDDNKYKKIYDETRIDKKKPLHIAIEVEDGEIVKYLLECPNIDINIVDSNGKTPLQIAIEKENFDIVEIMINFIKKKEIELTNEEKNRLIDISIEKLNPNILEYLLKHLDISVTDEQINKLSGFQQNSDYDYEEEEEEEEEEIETKYRKRSGIGLRKCPYSDSNYDDDYDDDGKGRNKEELENKKSEILELLKKYKNKNNQEINASKKLETAASEVTLVFESVNIKKELLDSENQEKEV